MSVYRTIGPLVSITTTDVLILTILCKAKNQRSLLYGDIFVMDFQHLFNYDRRPMGHDAHLNIQLCVQ